jgi:tetratricopeptide (TPR) repeat protein
MTPEGPITEKVFERMRLDIIAEGFSDLEMAQFIILKGLSKTSIKYAAEYAQKALDANPDDYQTLYVWAQTQTDNAIRIEGYRKLLEQNPNDAKVLFLLGSLSIDWEQKTKGAFEKSIGYLKRSAALDPDYACGQAYRFLGSIHVHLGDVEKGLAFYRLAQEIYDWEPTRETIARIEKGERP